MKARSLVFRHGPLSAAKRPFIWWPKNTAFTLIELLIVVLIIAILAAIAVPNFLEFQTRAKVARAHSDLRNIATALEAYCVDNGEYPPSGRYGGMAGFLANPYPQSGLVGPGGVILLSTPIAYLSSYPKDPFLPQQRWSSQIPQIDEMYGKKNLPYPYVQTKLNSTYGPRNGYKPERAMGIKWQAWSYGPTGRGWYYYPPRKDFPSKLNPYDPTNGTMSLGSVGRWGPGGIINRFEGEQGNVPTYRD